LVEALFQQLLQPPQPLLLALHAGLFKLLLVLCRADPLLPPVVALAANISFQMAPDLDPACWRELARWYPLSSILYLIPSITLSTVCIYHLIIHYLMLLFIRFSFHLTNTKLSWPYWNFWLDELAEAEATSADRDDARCCRVSCRGRYPPSYIHDNLLLTTHYTFIPICILSCHSPSFSASQSTYLSSILSPLISIYLFIYPSLCHYSHLSISLY
jgi:hypothetical protein